MRCSCVLVFLRVAAVSHDSTVPDPEVPLSHLEYVSRLHWFSTCSAHRINDKSIYVDLECNPLRVVCTTQLRNCLQQVHSDLALHARRKAMVMVRGPPFAPVPTDCQNHPPTHPPTPEPSPPKHCQHHGRQYTRYSKPTPPPSLPLSVCLAGPAPDFFEYFSATAPLLDSDETLMAVSAWNDNGQAVHVKVCLRVRVCVCFRSNPCAHARVSVEEGAVRRVFSRCFFFGEQTSRPLIQACALETSS